MRKNIKNVQFILFGLMLILTILSCRDNKWDMYDQKPGFLKEGSLLDLLTSKPEFSEFTGLLKKTGYDSVLRRTDLYTVLALKNGAFSSIDTTADMARLKMIIGMHILRSSIQRVGMKDNRYETVSGKHVDFLNSGAAATVNGIPVSGDGFKALNGLAYTVDQVIQPLMNLREVIATNPDYSIYNAYIDSSYTTSIDVEKNVIIGYDTKNQPIYQQPIVYKIGSSYMDTVKLDDENVVSTLFIPTNEVVNMALARLLTERANQNGLIVPKVDSSHPDTTIGYFFIPRNLPYRGDSAILKDYFFKNITSSRVSVLESGSHTFSNLMGGEFSVSSSQTTQAAGTPASNGYYYTLKEANLPDVAYRKIFVFDTFIQNPANPAQFIINPAITFSMGASANVVTKNAGNYHNRAAELNFNNVNGRMDFTLPFLTSGNYKVFLQYVPINQGGIFNTSFGSTQLKQRLDASILSTRPEGEPTAVALNADLGSIHQAADGPATLTITCASLGPLNSASYKLEMCVIRFVPI